MKHIENTRLSFFFFFTNLTPLYDLIEVIGCINSFYPFKFIVQGFENRNYEMKIVPEHFV